MAFKAVKDIPQGKKLKGTIGSANNLNLFLDKAYVPRQNPNDECVVEIKFDEKSDKMFHQKMGVLNDDHKETETKDY